MTKPRRKTREEIHDLNRQIDLLKKGLQNEKNEINNKANASINALNAKSSKEVRPYRDAFFKNKKDLDIQYEGKKKELEKEYASKMQDLSKEKRLHVDSLMTMYEADKKKINDDTVTLLVELEKKYHEQIKELEAQRDEAPEPVKPPENPKQKYQPDPSRTHKTPAPSENPPEATSGDQANGKVS